MIIVVYGLDSFRASQKIREMKEKFIKDVDELDTSFDEVDGKAMVAADLSRLFATDSLFAKKRLVLVKNIFANKQEAFVAVLADYLEKLQTDNIIIFHEEKLVMDKNKKAALALEKDKTKALSKTQQKLWQILAGGYVMYCPLLNDAELVKWIAQKLAPEGLVINRAAERFLLGTIGSDLWALDNELNKLIAYKLRVAESTEITEADIKLLVNYELSQPIFDLTDAIGNRDKARALNILNQQLEQGEAPLYLLAMLNRQFKIILSVRQGLDNGLNTRQLAETLKLHSYVLQKSVNQARNYNLVTLKSIMGTLVKIDYNFKTGKLPIEMMLDVLIARL
ncbi:MAG TPA: DNA polymerase III subunit delta [bacterium]|nr:DNA polymerase III subunit delta [bacterium]